MNASNIFQYSITYPRIENGRTVDGHGSEATQAEVDALDLVTDFQGASDLDDGMEFATGRDATGREVKVFRWK